MRNMTKEEIKSVLDRVLTWPPERQQAAADMLLLLEAQEGELYHPTEDEWAAIEEGVEQVRRGDVVAAEDVDIRWKRSGS
jgi:hypothetical protein